MTYDQIKMLDECLAIEAGLNDRELVFLDNLDRNYRHQSLSAAQFKWLYDIASRGL